MGGSTIPTVAILGGGVGGLSAAQELGERGFDVTVYETRERFGGKARSIPVPDSATDDRKPLPGEHGFRFFPGFYRHLTDSMKRIPYGNNPDGVYDNLEPTTQMLMAEAGRPEVFPTETPESISGWRRMLGNLFARDAISERERAFFASRLLQFATSCERRRREEYDKISWWEFIDAESMSTAYQKFLGYGITQSLVAMRPEKSSTRTIGRVYLQLFRGLVDSTVDADSLLNGPSSEVWIDPWVTYLDDLGVSLRPETTVREIHTDTERVTGATVGRNGETQRIEADYYVGAVPVEVIVDLRTPDLVTAAPSLSRLDGLDTAWMNGIQFYLAEDATDVHGHGVYLDAPWSLTSISQRQFWSEFDPDDYGDGQVEGILSICISDWNAPGIVSDKPARECTAEEIKTEVLAQFDDHLETGSLDETDLVDWFLDPAIEFGSDGTVAANHEPLLLNTVRSLRHRPDARTAADNFVLAADYVRTTTDLASMEGANEAARRATNAIVADADVAAEPCELFDFEEPAVFDAPKRQDEIGYRLGQDHPGEAGRTIARAGQRFTPQIPSIVSWLSPR
ncbi:hydroxysqualene dehydroxylase [Halococcus salifodinae]|uniref:Amine oxidase n=1 Tax=Halococcus salifodinae DSM 8989 TaxID=1227456 RepID=M0MVU6_9EURY|nr:FAD-dependent oxidoreductase [Halococcus salifodinae]EMA49877.1 amine oxidase [Halococcus salifodinae DSM 8989]